MPHTAHLSATINVCWEDARHVERDTDVEVEFTYDGDDLNITKQTAIGSVTGIGEWEFDDLVWDAVCAVADEAYAEHMADLADMRAEAAYEARCERALA